MKIVVVVLWMIMVPAGSYAAASFSLPASKPGPATACLQDLPEDSIQYKIIKAADNTYGYNISKKGKILIHQSSIPCVKGNRGFSKKKDAEKLALLVMAKIRKGIMPPSVTERELQDLGLTY